MGLEWQYCAIQLRSILMFFSWKHYLTLSTDNSVIVFMFLSARAVAPTQRAQSIVASLYLSQSPITLAMILFLTYYCLNFWVLLVVFSKQIKIIFWHIQLLFIVTNIFCILNFLQPNQSFCRLGYKFTKVLVCRILFWFENVMVFEKVQRKTWIKLNSQLIPPPNDVLLSKLVGKAPQNSARL